MSRDSYDLFYYEQQIKSRYDDYKKQQKADGKTPNKGMYFHGTVLTV